MAAKIEDVAKRAGVSTATVSRALSQPDMVRPETRRRVLDAVRDLGYAPNAAARNLRSGTTMMVLVVLPKLANVVFSEFVRGIDRALAKAGYGLIIGDLDDFEDRERHIVRLVTAGHVDGVIVLTGRMPQAAGRSLAGAGLPVIGCGSRIDHPGVPNVLTDEHDSVAGAVRWLHGLGHRRFCYLGAWPGNVNDTPRYAGFLDGANSLGVPAGDLVRFDGDFAFESGAASAAAYLALPPGARPTGVVAGSDEMAIGFMKAVREAGLRVPEDLSVVGFDGVEFGRYCEPTLTTISQPRRALGEAAGHKLLAALDGRAGWTDDVILPTELVLRESTGPAPS